MALVNEHFLKLPGSYLFSDIAKRVNTFKITHPKQDIIRLGIGDVTRPLAPACVEAMHKAVEEMAHAETFRGYGPEQGYDFLIEAVIKNDYAPRGIHLANSEVFINDGAKSDTGNIGDILRHDNSVGVTDPIYPVYIDSNVMCGRAGVLEEATGRWSNVTYMPCTSENNFIPAIPDKRIDIVYLCYPNNPTGTTLTKAELKKWVDYALANDTLILFDAAYEAYIQETDVPHSIYEIKGAKKCAIEFRSFSKTAGFTGIRCGTEGTHRSHPRRRPHSAKPLMEPPPKHQVQRHFLYHPTGGRSHLYSGRQKANTGNHPVLYGQCPYHERGTGKYWAESLRRSQRSLPLGENPEWNKLLEILRPTALRSKRGRYAGHRLRAER